MFKKIVIRFLNGFCYSIAITMVIYIIIRLISGKFQMLPEFVAHFNGETDAFAVQLLLIGAMSAVTSAGTVIFETRKIGLMVQSVIYLAIMLSAWIPVACYVWQFYRYLSGMLSTVGSIVVTYGICWWIQYKHCRKDIDEINAKLLERRA